MESEIFTSDTHIARVVVMQTVSDAYRGYVYLRRANQEPEEEQPYQTEQDYPRRDLAFDAARALASRLLDEHEF